MSHRRILFTMALMSLLLLGLTGLASAGIEWSIKPITEFTMPADNMLTQGEVLGALPPGWRPTYNWETFSIDSTNYLTGTGSVLFELQEQARGRVYVDVGVDSSRTYKVGWITKIENLTPREDGGAIVWGVFFKDGTGAWINCTEALNTLPSDYAKGMEASGIVIRTPRTFEDGKPLSGTTGWFVVEITMDLPKLAQDFKAAGGKITGMRFEQLFDSGTGKVWLDGMYLIPVQ
ncbi:MAG TPA: hypothetical protein GXZ82_13010 [Firmicutes bacterium]|jgi:hypothetical protein|nr:hypothetical protein [Bacillota bacterium]